MKKQKPQSSDSLNIRYPLLFILITIFLSVFILLQGRDSFLKPSNKIRVRPGNIAPNFTLPSLDARPVSLIDFRGKVVLLNIWATWCPPCVQEMPSMEALYETVNEEDFEIIAISIDAQGAGAIIPFMEKYQLKFLVLTDPKGTIQNLYGTTGIPVSFIIDKEGIVVKGIIGALDWTTPETIRFFRDLASKPRSFKE
jgi:peroxiredoxin